MARDYCMKYFAYGSNMSLRRIQFRIPNAQWVGNYRLEQYALRFHKKSIDGSGKCDAFFTGNDEDYVLGTVYEISEEDKQTLDIIEGVGAGYEIKSVSVDDESGVPIEAFLYYATDIDPSRKPYSWYKIHVLTGALEAFFPQAYLESINNIDVIVDQDKARELQELAIYKK